MSNRSASRIPFASLFFLVAILSGRAEESLGDRITSEVRRIFSECRDSVVRVEAYDRHGKLSGTGFYADPAGTIYTLANIVADADEIFVISKDRRIPAKLLVADSRSGIALLKTEANSPFLPLGNPKMLSLASPVLAIGYAQDSEPTPTFGIIGGFDRQFLGRYFMTTHIRAILPVEAGFGGAPLLNLRGEVVGIVFSRLGSGGACYALPIDAAEKIRMDFVRFGEPRHGWVGVSVEEGADEVDGSRVKIVELSQDTPAGRSGLLNGDILLQVGDFKISRADDVIDASYFLTAGDRVSIVVSRNGERLSLDLRSTNHPVSATSRVPGMKDLHVLVPGLSPEKLKLD